MLKEASRSTPGMASATLYILIAAGVVFLVLLIAFLVLLSRPKKKAGETVQPRPALAASSTSSTGAESV